MAWSKIFLKNIKTGEMISFKLTPMHMGSQSRDSSIIKKVGFIY